MKYKLKEAMNMSGVGERERVTQNNVINLFVEKLRYSYLGNFKEFENTNINERDELNKFILEHLDN